MSVIRSAVGTLALAFTLAMPAGAELPAAVSSAKDESDTAAVIAKLKEKDPGLAKIFTEFAGYAWSDAPRSRNGPSASRPAARPTAR